jgi:hypothetical protein
MTTLREMEEWIEEQIQQGLLLVRDKRNEAEFRQPTPEVQGLRYFLARPTGAKAATEASVRLTVFGNKPVTLDSEVTSAALAVGGKKKQQEETRNRTSISCFGMTFDDLAKELEQSGGQGAGECQITCRNPANAGSFISHIGQLWRRRQQSK